MHPRINSKQDLINYSISKAQQGKPLKPADLFAMRNTCYADIEALRKRPLLVYATKLQYQPT